MQSSLDIRYARPDEFPALIDLDSATFGITYRAEDIEDARLDIDPERMLVAVDGERIVAASCEVPFELTLPGGHVDVDGLTWVSVEVTHRRRGVLRSLVERQVRSSRAAALVLNASEGGIYGRYGFGVATRTVRTVVDRRRAQLRQPLAEHGVRRLNTEQAREVLPAIHERWRRQTPGAIDRAPYRWQLQLRERSATLFHLVHDDGYVSYRALGTWDDPQRSCELTDYAICTPQAHVALWQVLLGLDLATSIQSSWIPADDELPLLLTDPRQVRTTADDDGLWVRPLDVARLLAARSYAVAVDLVVGVVDPLLGDGAYRLVGGPDGAECRAVGDRAGDGDVVLDVASLGSVVLGGSRLTSHARAGLVRGDRAVVTHLDRALLADSAPVYGTHF